MTAEVAVMNRLAIALATDSAVTVTLPSNKRKILNTAPKLFALSETEPVAAMIFRNASYGHTPWETIIKTFRAKHGMNTYGTIAEYATALIEYLSEWVGDFAVTAQENFALAKFSYELDLVRRVVDELRSDGMDEDDIVQHIKQATPNRIQQIEDAWMGNVGPADENEALERLWTTMNEAPETGGASLLTECLGLDEDKIAPAIDDLHNLAIATWRYVEDAPGTTGLVIAGFGADEMYPALHHVCVEHPITGQARAGVQYTQLGEDTTALIKPFAQQEMVRTFLSGIHPDYRRKVRESIAGAFERYKDAALDEVDDADRPSAADSLRATAEDLADDLVEKFTAFEQEEMWGPIIDMVENLGKDELAEVAETLVNLTSFRRRVTSDEDTVGGPVDVAVLSKGDGLIWIKRKHYFPPELNPRYFRGLQWPHAHNTRP